MNISDLSSGSQSNESPTTTSNEFKSSSDEDTADIALESWCSGKDLLKAEALREEEARRLAEQIVSLVEIEKGDSPLLCPPAAEFEIRENSDLWHCSPALPPPAVYGQMSPLRQPMPSPFALPVYGFGPPPADQIQNAYALTPNAYGHGTPLSVHQDVGGLAVEALDIAAPAQPASGRQDGVRRLSDFDRFSGYGQRPAAEVPPRHSKQQRAPRGHSASSRHRAEAIRESDVPPRFRRRKKADGASLRAKDWAPRSKEHCASFGPPPPRGSWNQGQGPAERTSIHQLMMKYH